MSSGAGDGLIWVAVGLGLVAIASLGKQLGLQRKRPDNNVAVIGGRLAAAAALVLFAFLR